MKRALEGFGPHLAFYFLCALAYGWARAVASL